MICTASKTGIEHKQAHELREKTGWGYYDKHARNAALTVGDVELKSTKDFVSLTFPVQSPFLSRPSH